MTLRTTSRLLLSALLAAGMATIAHGQSSGGQPGLDRGIIGSSASLSDAQKKTVSAFTAPLVEVLRTGTDSKALEDARAALVSPTRDPAATVAFRKGYGSVLVAELAPLAKGKDLRRALLAMQVMRFTRSAEAFDALIERTTPSMEPDAGKRIAAATLLVDGLPEADAANAYFESAARKLRDAAGSETDWRALQQKLLAMNAASMRKELSAENARNIRRTMAETLATVAKSLRAGSKPDQRMFAIQRVLIGIRNDIILMPQADRSAFGRALAPMLGDLLQCAAAQWTAAHADPEMSASFNSVANACEVLLRLIDRAERPSAYAGVKPEADSRILAVAWESKDKAKFDAETKRWSDIVAVAPYKN